MSVVSMKKVSLMGRRKDEDATLLAVQRAGLMHVVPFDPGLETSEQISFGIVDDKIAKLQRALDAIESFASIKSALQPPNISIDEAINTITQSQGKIHHIEKELETLDSQIEMLEPWGDFDPKDLESINKNGVSPFFCAFGQKIWEKLDKERLTYSIINKTTDYIYVMILEVGETALPVTPLTLPKLSISSLIKKKNELKDNAQVLKCDIASFAFMKPTVQRQLLDAVDLREILVAKEKTLREKYIFGLTGYIPRDSEIDFRNRVCEQIVALYISDPVDGEEVPVKLKNNIFVSGFETIVNTFSGIKYGEKDYTWTVCLLFIVFGSLCLLDAGYGFVLMLLGLMLAFKGKKELGHVFVITGGFATILGALGGQVFGLILGKDFWPNLQPPIKLATDPLTCFVFSLVVGLVVMAFSSCVAIWQRGIKTQATGSLFFACGIGSFIVQRQLESDFVLATSFNLIGIAFFVATFISWLVFPQPVFGKNSRIPNIIWTLYSGVTGLAQDVLSHMRLFGIALSGTILAMVVNKISGMMPIYATVLFAFFGHSFVFVLSLLSLYIHTNRLIFLEFGSKCIDGGHFRYSPLSRSSNL